MEKYLETLNQMKQTNCLYFEKIVNHTRLITSRVDAYYVATQGKKNLDFEQIFEKVPKIIEMVFPSLSSEKNQQYHEAFQSSLSEISKILRKYNIFLNEDIASFLLKSPDIFIQNEALILFSRHHEAKSSEALKAISSDLPKLKEGFEFILNKPDSPSPFGNFAHFSSNLKRKVASKNLSILLNLNPETKAP